MKLHGRITLHFTYQLVINSLLVFLIMLGLFLVLISRIANEDIEQNFTVGALTSIIDEAYYEQERVTLPDYWHKLLEEKRFWLQVINKDGMVAYAINTASDVQASYTFGELVDIRTTGQLGRYRVVSGLDQSFEHPFLFLLGYENMDELKLAQWYSQFGEQELIEPESQSALTKQLLPTNSRLIIISLEGETLQAFGNSDLSVTAYPPVELLAMQMTPGGYETAVAVFQPENSELTWVLLTPNEPGVYKQQPIYHDILRVFIWIGVAMLVMSLVISIWHGYRYAKPLILFSGWFERMGSGRYDEVLTARDRKRVFRKNGKLRLRYRLYREVIQSFYDMAEKLAQLEKERSKLEKTREEWMSGISHDLRTPLSSIQGYGYILENMPAQWDMTELTDMGKTIREKSDYMLELISDFSHIYQLKHSSELIQRQELELGELVRRAVLKYVNDATLANVQFYYEGEEQPVRIMGNEMWLQRLMDNLLSNAVKHNSAGVSVTAASGMLNDEAFIRVADNGKGMDKETVDKLFERYYRGTSTEETTVGSGLGMSIAKMIVEAHNGRIEIRSAPGEGTEITIYLADGPAHA
jgi:signal transduction histidine kinase